MIMIMITYPKSFWHDHDHICTHIYMVAFDVPQTTWLTSGAKPLNPSPLPPSNMSLEHVQRYSGRGEAVLLICTLNSEGAHDYIVQELYNHEHIRLLVKRQRPLQLFDDIRGNTLGFAPELRHERRNGVCVAAVLVSLC